MKIKFACPICQSYTFRSPEDIGDICPVCFWELEGFEHENQDTPKYGPNGDLSVAQARVNYQKFRAVQERFIKEVRHPLESEKNL